MNECFGVVEEEEDDVRFAVKGKGGKSLRNMQATCKNRLGRLSWLVKCYAWLRAATCFQPAYYAWLVQNAA